DNHISMLIGSIRSTLAAYIARQWSLKDVNFKRKKPPPTNLKNRPPQQSIKNLLHFHSRSELEFHGMVRIDKNVQISSTNKNKKMVSMHHVGRVLPQ
ncbi:hypothetical protein, partial [Hyphomonas sp.]|uniref:hypothetical protein n=1 Tax=Hyphomonas sp. TaxID=87 RepID=UPI00329681B1